MDAAMAWFETNGARIAQTILPVLIALFVGILLAQHSAWLQRRNWHLQEAMKAYVELFGTGNEALRVCNTVWIHASNLDAYINDAIRSSSAPLRDMFASQDLVERRKHLAEMQDRFYQTQDPVLGRCLGLCWMLERKTNLRRSIEEFQAKYLETKVDLRTILSRIETQFASKGLAQALSRAERKPAYPDLLFDELNKMQLEVGRKYFHNWKC
jgi:hypothetical protein